MADRNFDALQILGREKKVIAGSFRPNGSSAIDNTLNKGSGFTVARTGAGVFTITLTDKYIALDSGTFQLFLGTPAAQVLCGGAFDVVSGKTVTVTNFTAGAAADIASNAANWIQFVLVLSNSAVTG